MSSASLEVTHQRSAGAEQEALLEHFERMLLLRKFDETADRIYGLGKIAGTIHLYIGQEAIAAGVCSQLQPGDVITSTHRGHGHCLAVGSDPRAMFAELLGRSTGSCKGLGGSMHVADRALGNLGANGIVGAGVPIATGAALHFKLSRSGNVAVAFMGDGAPNEGCVHEALNLAAIWKLPVVFVVENNQYGISSRVTDMYAIRNIAERGSAYGLASTIVDGQDVAAVQQAAVGALRRARSGGGPTLVEMKTYRYRGHSKNDPGKYRSREEVAEWRKRDPILLLRSLLLDQGASKDKLDAIESEVAKRIARAATEADSDPLPDPSELGKFLFAEPAVAAAADAKAGVDTQGSESEMTFAEAVNYALAAALRQDAASFLIGEDIGKYGGSFGVTRGLYEEFGGERIRDAPISEAAIAGAGVGAALVGGRPIVEIQFSDFMTNAMDAVVNQAAKLRFMSGGKMAVPLVIRTPMGGGIGMAAQHSQCLESWFYHVPGLKVVAPSTPDDARGLLLTAIRDGNPVIFLEHKRLYPKKGVVSHTATGIPFGRARIRRVGADATIVTYSAMVDVVLAAAGVVTEHHGLELEVIDLRSLVPIDWETIETSVSKTGRLAVCHEAVETGGLGGDIVARICAGPMFQRLRGPVLRVGAKMVPVPYSPVLEAYVLPSVESVVADFTRWLGLGGTSHGG